MNNRHKNRYVLLDLIRLIAIVLVLTAHISQTTNYFLGDFFGIKGFYFVSLGGVAVTLFFILSGLVLELVYGNCKIQYARFIKKRVNRLYPVYYIAVLLSLCLMLMYGVAVHKLPERIINLNLSDIFLTLTGTYVFAGRWGGPFLPTSWFLGIIMIMYLLFPLLSSFTHKRPHITVSTLFIVSVFARLILGRYDILPYRPLDWFPLCRVFEFGFGIYLGTVTQESVWLSVNNLGSRAIGLITFASNISFPLFLIHYPLKPLINILSQKTHIAFSIIIYLTVSLALSWAVIVMEKRILGTLQRKSQRHDSGGMEKPGISVQTINKS